MLDVLVTMRHGYTFQWLLAGEMRELLGRIRIHSYDQLPFADRRALDGHVLFSDLERLDEAELRLAVELAHELEGRGQRVSNHPARALRRYELLRHLHDAGVNRSRARWLRDVQRPARYPVFLRRASEHHGTSRLLGDLDAFQEAAGQARRKPWRDDMLVVEFCNVADGEGIFRKYGAFLIAGEIIPRHLVFSRRWMQKDTDLVEPRFQQEEMDYLLANPHAAALTGALAGTGLDYGRIDYGLHEGRVQIWEVNTNPIVINLFRPFEPDWHDAHALSMRRIRAAFARLAG